MLPIHKPPSGRGDHIVDMDSLSLASTTPQHVAERNLAQICEWGLPVGTGFFALAFSLITALLLITIAKKDLSVAFGVATWILVAGTLLAGTVKACLGEWPWRSPHTRTARDA